MPRIDNPPSTVPGLVAVDVDVSGLDTFAGSVEGQLRTNFQPQATGLAMVYQVGSYFGIGHASAEVHRARVRYTECLQTAINQLVGYANATQILVDAARTVAARYRDTDALAAANAEEVRQALSDAVAAAAAARKAASAQSGVAR